MATTLAGGRPFISFASAPIASGTRVRLSMATHEGSLITIPFPLTLTRVLAVPRSMPMSREKKPSSQLNILRGLNPKFCSLGGYSSQTLYHVAQSPPPPAPPRKRGRGIPENEFDAALSHRIKLVFGILLLINLLRLASPAGHHRPVHVHNGTAVCTAGSNARVYAPAQCACPSRQSFPPRR